MDSGKLFVVATPIGNLKDITLRAIEVLKEVDYIVSEDTRQTVKILNHFEIKKTQLSYRDQNHHKMLPQILELLESGCTLALTTDSGTPLISDPGFKLVNEVRKAGYEVIAVPGPSAVIAALSVAGLPTDKFVFLGFLPKGSNKKAEILSEYGGLDATLVLYESPHRVIATLKEIKVTLGDRVVCVAKELTKVHDAAYCGTVTQILDQIPENKLKGEFVILIAKEKFSL